jgi:voltage-gated potassium channel Kch
MYTRTHATRAPFDGFGRALTFLGWCHGEWLYDALNSMARTIHRRIRGLRRHLRGVAWRGLILTSVIGVALTALWLGAGFSERPAIDQAHWITKLYYTLGLFVLGGLDLGTPIGGSPLARGLLWFALFAAPAITAASVIEGVLRAVSPGRWLLRRVRNHFIVVGCGRSGRQYISRLRHLRPGVPIIVVDIRADHPALEELREVHKAYFLSGDIRDPAVLDSLRLQYAERVCLFTGDDFANLDATAAILERAPNLANCIVARVAQLHVYRLVSRSPMARQCEVVNMHLIAAQELVSTVLIEHFHRTEPRDTIVLAGFGRFGQTILDQLQREASDKFGRVVIIDLEAHKNAALFEQQVGFADFYERQIVPGDLCDPLAWQAVEGIGEVEPVFIIGSGDDEANMSTALWVATAFPRAFVMVRGFYRSEFADLMARDAGFTHFALSELVNDGMSERWFGIAPSER